MDEMDLAEIGLERVLGDSGTVLDRRSAVSIAFDSKALEEADRGYGRFGYSVVRPPIHGYDSRLHGENGITRNLSSDLCSARTPDGQG